VTTQVSVERILQSEQKVEVAGIGSISIGGMKKTETTTKDVVRDVSHSVNIFKWAVEIGNLPLLSLSVKCFMDSDLEVAKASLVELKSETLQPVLLALSSRDVNLAQSLFLQGLLRSVPYSIGSDERVILQKTPNLNLRELNDQISERVYLILDAADNVTCAPSFSNALDAVRSIMGPGYYRYARWALAHLVNDRNHEAIDNFLSSLKQELPPGLIPYMSSIAYIISKDYVELASTMRAFFRERGTRENETYEIITWICDYGVDLDSNATDVVAFIRTCDPPMNEILKVVGGQCRKNNAESLRRAFLHASSRNTWRESKSTTSFFRLFVDKLSSGAGDCLQALLAHGTPRDLRLLTELMCDLSPQSPSVVNEVICNLLLWIPMVSAVSRAFVGFCNENYRFSADSDATNDPVSWYRFTADSNAINDAVSWCPRGFDFEVKSYDKPEGAAIGRMFEALELLMVLKAVLPEYISDGDTPWRHIWQSLDTTKPLHEQRFIYRVRLTSIPPAGMRYPMD